MLAAFAAAGENQPTPTMHPATTGPLIGMMMVAGFAIGWVAAGTRSLGSGRSAWLVLAAAAISTGLVWRGYVGLQRGAGHVHYFDGLAYGLAVGFESVAIPLAAAILKRTGKTAHFMPVVALIVGVHFFGLVWAFRSPACWWLGGAMCLLALAAMTCLPETPARRGTDAREPVRLRDFVTGLGCAVILWCALLTTF